MRHQTTGFISPGMWGIASKARARCFDGVIRIVTLHKSPDSFFSWPGKVRIMGKVVKGYVTSDNGVLEFRLDDDQWSKLGIDKVGQ